MSAAKKQSRAGSSLHGFLVLSASHGIATVYTFRSVSRNILWVYSAISILIVAKNWQFFEATEDFAAFKLPFDCQFSCFQTDLRY